MEESNVQPVNSPVTVRAPPLSESARLHTETPGSAPARHVACSAQTLSGRRSTLDAALGTLDTEPNADRGLGNSSRQRAGPQEGRAVRKRPARRAARRCAATSTASSTTC